MFACHLALDLHAEYPDAAKSVSSGTTLHEERTMLAFAVGYTVALPLGLTDLEAAHDEVENLEHQDLMN